MNFKYLFITIILFCSYFHQNQAINLQKLKLKKVSLKNMTNHPVTLEIKLNKDCTDCADQYLVTHNITIPPQAYKNIQEVRNFVYAASSLNKDAHLNFKPDSNQHLAAITITDTQELDYLIHLDFFNPINQGKIRFLKHLKKLEKKDRKLKFAFPPDITPTEWISFLNTMYEQNNFSQKLSSLTSAIDEKVPFILHKIWLGSEIPLFYKRWINAFKKIHPNWRIILWTEEVVKQQFPQQLFNQDIFDQGRRLHNYSVMSDVLRWELLDRYGGLYMDTDVICFESFTPLNQWYDFFAALEPYAFSCLCSSAVVGAKKAHPIIQQAMINIKEANPSKNRFGKDSFEQEYMQGVCITGPGAITRAILKKANNPENCDIILPFIYFNNTQLNTIENIDRDLNRIQASHSKKYQHTSLCSHEFHGIWLPKIHEALQEEKAL